MQGFMQDFCSVGDKLWHIHLKCLTLCIQTHPPPSVPRDFTPLHKFSNGCSVSENQNDRQKPLTSTQRSQLLSDQPGKDTQQMKYSVITA